MGRYAFCLQLRAGMEEAYDEAHRKVWPEMLVLLKQAGISEYSIFRRDRDVVLVLQAEDFNAAWDCVEQDPVNARWQKTMAQYFDEMEPLRADERFPMMQEIFYMQ